MAVGSVTTGIGFPSYDTTPFVADVGSTDLSEYEQLFNGGLLPADFLQSYGFQLTSYSNVIPDDAALPALSPPVQLPPGTFDYSQPHVLSDTEKGLVLNFYNSSVSSQVDTLQQNGTISSSDAATIAAYLIQGTPLPPNASPSLTTVANKVETSAIKATYTGASLPSTWTPTATDSADWTRSAISAYTPEQQTDILNDLQADIQTQMNAYIQAHPNLTQSQINDLNSAAQGGKASSAAISIASDMKTTAQTDIQQKYDLPLSWTPKSTDTFEWTPIGAAIITPSKLTTATASLFLQSVSSTLQSLSQSAQTLVAEFPVQSQTGISLIDFLKDVRAAEDQLKQQMQMQQMVDAQSTLKASQSQQDMIQQKQVLAHKNQSTSDATMVNQHNQKALHTVLQIFGILVSVIMNIASIVAAVLSFGALSELVAATVVTSEMVMAAIDTATAVVSTVATIYMGADMAANITEKIATAFSNWVDSLCPPGSSTLEQAKWKAIATAIIIAILVVVIVACICAGGSGSAEDIAEQAGIAGSKAAVANSVVAKAGMEVTLMILGYTLMGGNAFSNLLSEEQKANNVGTNVSQAQQIALQVMQIFFVILTSIVSMNAKDIGEGLGGLGQTVKTIGTATVEGLQAFMKFLKEIPDIVNTAMESSHSAFVKMQQTLLNFIQKAATEGFRAVANDFADYMIKLSDDAITKVMRAFSNMAKEMVEQGENVKDATKLFTKAGSQLTREEFVNFFQAFGKAIQGRIDEACAAFKEALKEEYKIFKAGLKNDIKEELKDVDAKTRAIHAMGQFQAGFGAVSALTDMGLNAYQAALSFQQVDLMKEAAEITLATSILDAYETALQQFLDNLSEGMSDESAFAQKIFDFIMNDLYGGQAQAFASGAKAILG